MLGNQEFHFFENAVRDPKLFKSIGTYLDLRDLFADSTESGCIAFRKRFSNYYGIQYAGLTNKWKARYFELLYEFDQVRDVEPYEYLLLDLHKIPRHQGDQTLQFSFVSKLVAFHDESRPLWDGKVHRFFGLGPPKFGSLEFQISGFVMNLNEIACRYRAWTQDDRFSELLADIRTQRKEIASIHDIRLCDFLVHNARYDNPLGLRIHRKARRSAT